MRRPAAIGARSRTATTPFNELYRHRHALFLALLRAHGGWACRVHADGTMFDGHFIAGMDIGTDGDKTIVGHQITYHLPLDLWAIVEDMGIVVEAAPGLGRPCPGRCRAPASRIRDARPDRGPAHRSSRRRCWRLAHENVSRETGGLGSRHGPTLRGGNGSPGRWTRAPGPGRATPGSRARIEGLVFAPRRRRRGAVPDLSPAPGPEEARPAGTREDLPAGGSAMARSGFAPPTRRGR